jgi:Phosphodiester glycosidase
MRLDLKRLKSGNRAAAWAAGWLFLFFLAAGWVRADQATEAIIRSSHGITYRHDEIPDVPWSIHVVKVARANHELQIQSALARGARFGLATLSEQIRALPADLGKPVAGLNGDFFRRQEPYLGDPKGLQIVRGELVSGPCDWTAFWVDAEGNPHMTNVLSRFQVIWPTGQRTSFGLNEPRPRNGAVLYTPAVGSRTQTSGGRELILERNQTNLWLPLKPCVMYSARVRSVREGGDNPIPSDCMVLSLGRQAAAEVPAVTAGSVLQIYTGTWPELNGAPTAIGGGPAIVRDSRVIERTDARVRHPRSAIGWNKDFIFLVEVDGRQRDLSVGMTLRELATYLVKLGCTDAMNLDGGGSATCWVYGQVMNSPSEGEERGMGNSIVVVQKGSK